MSKKHHGPSAPVPPGNRPQGGGAPAGSSDQSPTHDEATKFQDHDPKHNTGDYTGTGEHSRVQPSPLNDGAKGGHGGRSKE